jgi:hypothetical protein
MRAGLPIALMAASFLPKVGEVAQRHPNLKLILDHAARNVAGVILVHQRDRLRLQDALAVDAAAVLDGTGSSSLSSPRSTSCIAATEAIAFVMEAMRKTVSVVIVAAPASSAAILGDVEGLPISARRASTGWRLALPSTCGPRSSARRGSPSP